MIPIKLKLYEALSTGDPRNLENYVGLTFGHEWFNRLDIVASLDISKKEFLELYENKEVAPKLLVEKHFKGHDQFIIYSEGSSWVYSYTERGKERIINRFNSKEEALKAFKEEIFDMMFMEIDITRRKTYINKGYIPPTTIF